MSTWVVSMYYPTFQQQLGITAAHGPKKTTEYLTPLWRLPTSQQRHKARQIPDSEYQRLRHAVERSDDLFQSRPDWRIPADPGSPGRHPEDGHHGTFRPVRILEDALPAKKMMVYTFKNAINGAVVAAWRLHCEIQGSSGD
ncbi:hypothetical protein T10_9234 [Trichinella papuae]|uniref:Uncharacterized protein n=1 Tax=Trichinella papuae TaxID=268474 RepID=A0A0V1MFW4_9BILA|nr:hypothetical protein T10_9234 [Trichinella papuae]